VKLLFDENLSPRLPELLGREFPGSNHIRDVGLVGAADSRVWDYEDGAVLVNMGSRSSPRDV
jgi:predicted nuclease of predicted toxin-antitoxin system